MEVSSRTYTLVVEKFPDGYLAYFPTLPGCHTWGKTFEDAVTYAEDALAHYVDALLTHGDPIPEETGITQPVSLGITVRKSIIA